METRIARMGRNIFLFRYSICTLLIVIPQIFAVILNENNHQEGENRMCNAFHAKSQTGFLGWNNANSGCRKH